MLLKYAKEVALQWVTEVAEELPGFGGAFFHGSVNWMPDQAELLATSDLDIMVVIDAANQPQKLGKFDYWGVLLEVSYLSSGQLRSAEQVLGQYNLAGSFHTSSVIADPSGQLTTLQTDVARRYAERDWVRRRCEDARAKVLQHLRSLDESAPFHDQVTSWLFGTGVTTHVLLVAGLKNPTVRKRYLAVRELLEEYDRLEFYGPLLGLLGCDDWSRATAERHLASLAGAFDAAKTVIKTPVFFAADISDLARPVAIDGTQELIDLGFHREAVFWLAATYARCMKVLHSDATPELQARFEPGLRALLADLGITSLTDLQRRSREVEAFLPEIRGVAEEIMNSPRVLPDSMTDSGRQ